MATVQSKKSFSAQRSSMVGGAWSGSSGGRVLRCGASISLGGGAGTA